MADVSTDPPFEVAVAGAGPVSVTCAGELDLATVSTLRGVIETIDDDVVIDCARVTFLDSSAMALLAAQRIRLVDQGHSLAVTNLQDTPRRALEIGGLDDLIR